MFENTTFFIITKNNNDYEVKRLNLTRDSQKTLCKLFGKLSEEMLDSQNEFIQFDGSYKPDNGEIQIISEYRIDEKIIDSLREPTSVDPFIPDIDVLPDIKGIFTGKLEPEIIITFQKFNKSQYITKKGISLFYSNNTFEKVSSLGINILENVDCIYKSDGLFFKSYYHARQIFDLSQYYRLATENDINNFIKNDHIYVNNEEIFKVNADAWVRRKIALISDSGVLETYTAGEIAEKGIQYNLNIDILEDRGKNKISLPEDKKEMKTVLKFLDEDIYKGPFSRKTYETNSKRYFNR